MPDEPRRGTKTAYVTRIDALLKSLNNLEDEAVRRAVSLLRDAMREINQRVVTAEGWKLSNLESLKRQVTDIMAQFQTQYTAAFAQMQAQAYQIGIDTVDNPLKVSGVTLTPARLSQQIVAVLQGFSADLIKNISTQTLTSINATLAQSLLGLQSPFDAQKRITQIVGASDSLRDLTGISARAESIFRTEIGRISSIATQARQEQVAREVPDMMKVWVATGDHRTRSGHLAAHGQTVKIDEPFHVAPLIGQPKEEIMYPHDPGASEANSINCRCRSISWRAGYGAPVPKTTARVEQQKQTRGMEWMR